MRTTFAALLLALAVHSAAPLFAQDSTKSAAASADAKVKGSDGSSAAHPEAVVLKRWVGNWDATIESTGRDGKPVINAAKATVKLIGARWLITDFEGTFLGAPFIGHEVLGYDPVDKKYVLNWVDGMATSFATGEGHYDPRTKTLTLAVSGRDGSKGTMATWRQVDVWKDADHHDWTLRVISPMDGREQIQMTIRYSRRK
jgi:Protein of unknown function (DUF1579)